MKRTLLFLIIIVSVCFFFSCTKHFALGPSITQKGSGQPFSIAFITKMQTGEHWGAIKSGARNAAIENGVSIEFFAPISETNYSEQINLINYAIEKNFDAIVIASIDTTALNSAIEEACKKGIRVVTIDSGIVGIEGIPYIGSHNYELGRIAMQKGLELVKKENLGSVIPIIIGSVEQSANMVERIKGIVNELSSQGIVPQIMYSGAEELVAQHLITEALKKDPTTNLIIALEENSAQGAAKAVALQKLNEAVPIVAFGSSIEEINMLENGIIDVLFVENLFNMGYLGVTSAIDATINKRNVSSVTTDYVVITKDTLMEIVNQRFAFPIY